MKQIIIQVISYTLLAFDTTIKTYIHIYIFCTCSHSLFLALSASCITILYFVISAHPFIHSHSSSIITHLSILILFHPFRLVYRNPLSSSILPPTLLILLPHCILLLSIPSLESLSHNSLPSTASPFTDTLTIFPC